MILTVLWRDPHCVMLQVLEWYQNPRSRHVTVICAVSCGQLLLYFCVVVHGKGILYCSFSLIGGGNGEKSASVAVLAVRIGERETLVCLLFSVLLLMSIGVSAFFFSGDKNTAAIFDR